MRSIISITEHRIQCPSCLKVWGWHNDFPQQQCPRCNEIFHAPHPDDKPTEPIEIAALTATIAQQQADMRALAEELINSLPPYAKENLLSGDSDNVKKQAYLIARKVMEGER